MTNRFDSLVLGGGVAGLTAALQLAKRGAHVCLLEASDRLGGVVKTLRHDGFEVDVGPDVFLTRKPGAVELAAALEVETRPARGGALIQRDRQLVPLPAGLTGLVPGRLGPLITTRALGLGAKLRAAAEPLVPARSEDTDESLEAFAVRRFGRGAWVGLIEPLLGGLYGADDGPISLRSTLPHLHQLERQGGFLKLSRTAAREGSPFARPVGGMGTLVEALATAVRTQGGHIQTEARVARVERADDGFMGTLADGTTRSSETLIVALPAPWASRVLATLDADLAAPLDEIPMGSATAVVLGVASDGLAIPDGSGWLVPAREGGAVQAVTMFSAKHPGTAPDGHALFRVFLRPTFAHTASDEQAVDAALQHLRQLVGPVAPPVWTAVQRWRKVQPRYTLGHPDRLDALDAAVATHPGLALIGASLRGVGLPDVIRHAQSAADQLQIPVS